MGSTLDVVVLDPNSDHVMIGSLADPDDTGPDAERFRSVQQSVSTFRARGDESTHTLCIDFSDVDPDVQAKVSHHGHERAGASDREPQPGRLGPLA